MTPRMPKSQLRHLLKLTVTDELVAWLDERAREQRSTRAEVARAVLNGAMEEK